jgi:integrase
MSRRRTGTIEDRGTSFRIKYVDAAGETHRETFPIPHQSERERVREEAERELALRMADLHRGVPVSALPHTVLFGELADDVLTDYEANNYASFDDQEARYRLHLIPVFGHQKAAQITTAQIRKYITKRKAEDAATGTICRELELLRHTFLLAKDGGKLLAYPKVPMLEENNVRTGFFTREEVARVAANLPEPQASKVWFAYLTGWRDGEICKLEWSWVDLVHSEIRLPPGRTKNKKGRTFPLYPELQAVLERLDRMGKPFQTKVFTVASMKKSWKTACYKAGIPCTVEPVKKGGKRGAVKVVDCSRTFHDLRRSAIREWKKKGMQDKTAMMLSGHLTRSVFDRYNIVSEEDLREAVRVLGNSPGNSPRLHQN